MSLSSAQQFVVRMREDKTFRHRVRSAAAAGELPPVLQKNGFAFELHQLIAAMAACMQELEQCSGVPGAETRD
jgi:hypothetical protein